MGNETYRIALFSGNYNYVRDGANKALNRLVKTLLSQGHSVRIYSPTTNTPAFEPVGELVSAPSFALPFGRGEYRMALPLFGKTKRDLEAFAPDIVHVSSPDMLGQSAVGWAKKRQKPVLASMHTRFDIYMRYYKLGFLEPVVTTIMRRLYNRADIVVAPSQSMIEAMREADLGREIRIWGRGIEGGLFHPSHRSQEWRASNGISENDIAIGFIGRLVMEKGLPIFVKSIKKLQAMAVQHRVLVIGDGPARSWLAERLPDAHFTGFLQGEALGHTVANLDLFFNPSESEAFGNVTLEAMAAGVPVVAADATGARDLVASGISGTLVKPNNAGDFAMALAKYCQDRSLRIAHGLAGHEASKSYDWEAINQPVLDAYHELIQANRNQHGA